METHVVFVRLDVLLVSHSAKGILWNTTLEDYPAWKGEKQEHFTLMSVFLGCNAVWTCSRQITFRRNTLSPSSGLLKLETVCFSETLVIYLQAHTALQPRRPTLISSPPWEPQISRAVYVYLIKNSLNINTLKATHCTNINNSFLYILCLI
jgi:hypothetical protein